MRSLSMMGSRAALVSLVAAVLATATIAGLSGCKKKTGDAAFDAGLEASVADASADTPDASDALVDAGADTGAPTTTQIAAPPSPFADGQNWVGSYTCAQGASQLTLIIHSGPPRVTGAFSFKKGQVVGQFKVSGRYEASTRHLRLSGGDWINRPGTYSTVDLDGTVSADGRTYSGSVVGPGCSTFSVHR